MSLAGAWCYRPPMKLVLVGGLGAAALAGCGGAAAPGCADLPAGLERDRCYHEQIDAMPAERAAEVRAIAERIADPIVRGAAVSSWVANHGAEVERAQGEALCALLDGRDRSYCQRRLSSPHLRRGAAGKPR